MKRWSTFVLTLVLAAMVLLTFPPETKAIRFLEPFGGKVTTFLSDAPGCFPIKAAAALVGIDLGVEELTIGGENGGAFGLIKIDGVYVMPTYGLLPNRFYRHSIPPESTYQTTGTWVLGNSFSLCNVCGLVDDVPLLGDVCGTILGDVIELICGALESTCPIFNPIFNIGSGAGPDISL